MDTIKLASGTVEQGQVAYRNRIVIGIKRGLVALAFVLVALAVSGATYQVVASGIDQRSHTPPGQLVDVGGYRLHIQCMGEGSPTVILEDGGGGLGALDFAYIQPDVAHFTRVCAYDRAGYGWSDPGPEPRTAQQIVTELHTLLTNANIQGPYVLGGLSLGGWFTRLYQAQFPSEVVGLVLIDSSHEDEWTHAEERAGTSQFAGIFDFCRHVLAPLGVWRLVGETGLFSHPLVTYLSPDLQSQVKPTIYRTTYCGGVYAETNLMTLDIGASQVKAARHPLGALPLVVVTAGTPLPGETEAQAQRWAAWQLDLATLSSNSRYILVPHATHITIGTVDASFAVDALRQVVEAVRIGQPLEQ